MRGGKMRGDPGTENAAPDDPRNGAQGLEKAAKLSGETLSGGAASGKGQSVALWRALETLAGPRHLRAIWAIGRALVVNDPALWFAARVALETNLTAEERTQLAGWTLQSLDPDLAHQVAEAVLHPGAGAPVTPFEGFIDAATAWVRLAGRKERLVYANVILRHISPRDLAEILEFYRKRIAA